MLFRQWQADNSEMMMELTFLQKIILLALDDKGWFGTAEHKIKFGLVGAILFELHQRGRINFVNDEVVVVNPKSTDDVVLDRVLNLVKSAKKSRTSANSARQDPITSKTWMRREGSRRL